MSEDINSRTSSFQASLADVSVKPFMVVVPQLCFKIVDEPAQDEAENIVDRNALVLENKGLAMWFAKKYLGCGIEFDDIIQAAMIGLITAASRYDPAKAKFSTYAAFWIKYTIRRELQNTKYAIRIPSWMWALHHKVLDSVDCLRARYNRAPTLAEVGEDLQISVKKIKLMQRRMASAQTVQLDCSDGEQACLGVRDRYSLSAEQYVLAHEELDRALVELLILKGNMRALSTDDRQIFTLYYDLDAIAARELTYAQVARTLGISSDKVTSSLNRSWRLLANKGVKLDRNTLRAKVETIAMLKELLCQD